MSPFAEDGDKHFLGLYKDDHGLEVVVPPPASELEAQSKAKSRRLLWIIIAVLAIILVLVVVLVPVGLLVIKKDE